jgi:ribosome maturation factor RimP
MDIEESLFQLLEPVLREYGYELVLVEITGLPSRRNIRVFVDREGGINVEDCARATRIIDPLIESRSVFPGSYVLEVSSPGLDRPLFKETDYERFTGRKVRIRLRRPIENRRNFTGILRGLKDKKLILVELEEGIQVELPLEEIQKANLVFEWK